MLSCCKRLLVAYPVASSYVLVGSTAPGAAARSPLSHGHWRLGVPRLRLMHVYLFFDKDPDNGASLAGGIMKSVSKKEGQAKLKRNEEKWTPALMDAGWTAIPSVLLERQQALGLDSIDLNIIMHLARHWWYLDNLPRPGKKTIAECMCVHESTVRRRIARMEVDGLITRKARYDKRYGGQQTNEYSFEGLIRAATPYAKEAVQKRLQRQKEDVDTISRKRPLLKVVRSVSE